MKTKLWWVVLLFLMGCRHLPVKSPNNTYSNPQLGFEVSHPASPGWAFAPGPGDVDVVQIPVLVVHQPTGTQVLVQRVPHLANCSQVADSLAAGLKARGGFQVTDLQPLPLAEGAVGFSFSAEGMVGGRVAVLEGSKEHMFVLLGTWPVSAPTQVVQEVDQVLGSFKVLSGGVP